MQTEPGLQGSGEDPNPKCEEVNPETGEGCTDHLLGHAYCHVDSTGAAWPVTPEASEDRCPEVFDGWRCLFPANHWVNKGWTHQWYMYGRRIPSIPARLAPRAKAFAPWAHANELQWDRLSESEEGVVQSAVAVVNSVIRTCESEVDNLLEVLLDSETWEILAQNAAQWGTHMIEGVAAEASYDNAELVFHDASLLAIPAGGPPKHPEWTITEAAKSAGVSRHTVYRLLNEGKLPNAHRGGVNGAWLVSMTDLNAAGLGISYIRSPNAEPKWGTVQTVRTGTCRHCGYPIHPDKSGTWQHDGSPPFNGTQCWPD